jgi:hypothetical protein
MLKMKRMKKRKLRNVKGETKKEKETFFQQLFDRKITPLIAITIALINRG